MPKDKHKNWLMKMAEEFSVTPWEVQGTIDYEKLIKEFGTQEIDEPLSRRLENRFGERHYMLRRRIFYSHRDLNWLLDLHDKGTKFYLYTGRGPSGHTHIGHLLPWIFTKYLQDKFGVNCYFQLTDDEKFLFNHNLSLDDTKKMAYENALDFIALGFKPERTRIFLDTEYIKTLYPIALKVAKRITFSTTKAVFGFNNSNNIGSIFYTSMQAAPCFLEGELKGTRVPCLIPCAIDQDPHFRICRDVAESINHYKPALIHCKMLPSLGGSGKMSASSPDTSIFTTDSPKTAAKKIGSAFTGGAVSVEEQRKNGGNPDVCAVFSYFHFLFEPDDERLTEIRLNCTSGRTLCGECKRMLSEKVAGFLETHQERREAAKEHINDFFLRD